jgi:type VI secretion system secreted protein Hcp
MGDSKNHGASRVGHHLVVGALAAAATIGATGVVAATDMFLKIGDIKGESADKQHPGEIEVLAWSWGVNGPAAGVSKKDGGPACSEPLSVEKFVDSTTPPLATGASLNTTFPAATLTVRKSGDRPIEFVVVKLAGVTVKTLENGGPDGEGYFKEKLTLAYKSAAFTYTPQKADGSAGASMTGSAPASCP